MSKGGRVIITRKRLDALRDEMAQSLRVGLVKGMTSVRDDVSAKEILTAFKKGDFSELREDIEGKIRDVASPLLSKAFKQTADETAKNMTEVPNGAYALDNRNPRVREYIDSRTKILADTTHEGVLANAKATGKRSTLITTREPGISGAVGRMVTKSLDVGMTLPQRAEMIRQVIGLNGPQGIALENYRKAQAANGITGSRLEDRIAERSETMLDYRANTIARQEVRNAQNTSQLEVWKQSRDDEFIPKDTKKVWVIESSACIEWCLHMDGVGVLLDEMWSVKNTRTGEVVEVDIPSDIHVHCQCSQSVDTAG